MTLTPVSASRPLHAPHIKLRQATDTDLDTLHDLILAVGLSTERSAITATLEGCTYWVAELDGVPAGCIGLEHGEGVSLLRSASVLPGARRQGLGRALATSALTHATLRGDRAVYLFSSDAGPFWQTFGFAPVPMEELEAALPSAPQVVSGQCRGWIRDEVAWKREVLPSGGQPVEAAGSV
ncbi:GNAT family N-acetyltransferase [Deinococcus hopiensis]|uniref:N-acetylglutamate synthase, GNAT family n=1 Tax=Deinococcus hopiensis KR-140 TaxID=695939 RepID=A0A1W1VQX0_9DEIO|nr:GNAT family N-acetyltransferase [Deinococcus hopiensis]SMB95782.1 N-acetylglutamate synthase, GNAT family [Deinococcus hopiensis KR-140]